MESITFTNRGTVAEFFGKLVYTEAAMHAFHTQNTSYAQHMAIGSYYEAIADLTDALIESYQGEYGIIKYKPVVSNAKDAIAYLEELSEYIEKNKKLFTDSYILNQLDTICELNYSTLYKLKFLK